MILYEISYVYILLLLYVYTIIAYHLSGVMQDFGFDVVTLFVHHIYLGMKLLTQRLWRYKKKTQIQLSTVLTCKLMEI